jgi:hypothetical protein
MYITEKDIFGSSCSHNYTWVVDKPTCRQASITGATKISFRFMPYDWKIQGIEFNNEYKISRDLYSKIEQYERKTVLEYFFGAKAYNYSTSSPKSIKNDSAII